MKIIKFLLYLRYRLLFLFSTFIFVFPILTSCTKEYYKAEPLNFLNFERLIIIAKSFRVKTNFQPALKDPFIGHLLPDPLLDATRRWGEHRFTVLGSQGSALLTILKAEAVRENLSKREGIEGLLYEDQELRIKMEVEVLLEIFNENGKVIARMNAKSKRERTFKEGLSINARDESLMDMERHLFIDLDNAIFKEINQKIPQYFRAL